MLGFSHYIKGSGFTINGQELVLVHPQVRMSESGI